jgi:multidrug efflux system membrane fusion protein
VRPVEPGLTVGGRVVVQKGLAEGERVVTDGQLRLTPGSKVTIREALGQPTGPQGERPSRNEGDERPVAGESQSDHAGKGRVP